MVVLIVVAVAELLAYTGHGIAEGARHGQCPGLLDDAVGGHAGELHAVALGCKRKVDGQFVERDEPFGDSHEVVSFAGAGRKQQGVRVGKADVFHAHAHETAQNESRVFAALDHAVQPVECSIGVRATHGLVQCRNQVVVFLAALVVTQRLFVLELFEQFLVDFFAVAKAIANPFNLVQQESRIAFGLCNQFVYNRIFDFDILELQAPRVVAQCAVDESAQVLFT